MSFLKYVRSFIVFSSVSIFVAAFATKSIASAIDSNEQIRLAVTNQVLALSDRSSFFKLRIEDQIYLTTTSLEFTRRGMLLCRSPKLDRTRAEYEQPFVKSVARDMAFYLKEKRNAIGLNSARSTRALQVEMALANYTTAELKGLANFLSSRDGQIALQTSEVRDVLRKQISAMVNVNMGLPWSWPARPLFLYFQDLGLTKKFLSLSNSVAPGSGQAILELPADFVTNISDLVDDKVLKLDWYKVLAKFEEELSPVERQAIENSIFVKFDSSLERFESSSLLQSLQYKLLPLPSIDDIGQACVATTGTACSQQLVLRLSQFAMAVSGTDELSEFIKSLANHPESGCSPRTQAN